MGPLEAKPICMHGGHSCRAFDGSWPVPRLGSGAFQNLTGRVGSFQKAFGTSRVGCTGQEVFEVEVSSGLVEDTFDNKRGAPFCS